MDPTEQQQQLPPPPRYTESVGGDGGTSGNAGFSYQPLSMQQIDQHPPAYPQTHVGGGTQYPQTHVAGGSGTQYPQTHVTGGGGTQFPGYYPASANFAMQQSSSNVVVVSQQPAPLQTAVFVRQPGDAAIRSANTIQLVLAIVCIIITGLGGCWSGFICLIPALIFAAVGMEHPDGKQYSYAALGFNIAAIVNNVLITIGVAVYLGILLSATKQP